MQLHVFVANKCLATRHYIFHGDPGTAPNLAWILPTCFLHSALDEHHSYQSQNQAAVFLFQHRAQHGSPMELHVYSCLCLRRAWFVTINRPRSSISSLQDNLTPRDHLNERPPSDKRHLLRMVPVFPRLRNLWWSDTRTFSGILRCPLIGCRFHCMVAKQRNCRFNILAYRARNIGWMKWIWQCLMKGKIERHWN